MRHIRSGTCTDSAHQVRHKHKCDTFSQSFVQMRQIRYSICTNRTHQVLNLHMCDTSCSAYSQMRCIRSSICNIRHMRVSICIDATHQVRHWHRCNTLGPAFAQIQQIVSGICINNTYYLQYCQICKSEICQEILLIFAYLIYYNISPKNRNFLEFSQKFAKYQ